MTARAPVLSIFKLVGGLVSFNGISTFAGYLMPKTFSKKNRSGTTSPIGGRIKGVHAFPKGISPKVNVIERLEFELAYYDSGVRRFNHYTTRTPPSLSHTHTHTYIYSNDVVLSI